MDKKKTDIKSIFKNLVFSFLSCSLPTAALQFVIQPIVANKLGAELNGQYLTLMTLVYFASSVTSCVLNTVRMLQNKTYEEEKVSGDFNIIFCLYSILTIILMPVGFILYTGSKGVLDIVLYVLVALGYLYHDYVTVQFKILLQYNKMFVSNIMLVLGYFIGIGIFYLTGKWQMVILTSYTLAGIYDYLNTTYIREPMKKTPLFNETVKKIGSLTLSSILGSCMTYSDKLILYPLLGGTDVSIYSTASIVGKILILVSNPLNNVLLSYLIKVDNFRIKISKKFVAIGILGLIVMYFGCLIVGYPIIDFLYADWADQSSVYVPVCVASSLFLFVSNLLGTIVLKYYKVSFQAYFQGINLAIYLGLSLLLMHFWSLWGFCIGACLANLIKMIILLVIIVVNINKPIENTETAENTK